MDNDTMVSVWCTTFNHINYIKDAIEGVLSQKTNFRYELIIYDDASTDGTREIVIDYKNRFPDIIKVILPKQNEYEETKKNSKVWYEKHLRITQGKYVAFCEGDDYWIDTGKLQIQVDYMEEHPGCVLSSHAARFWSTGEWKDNIVKNGDMEADLSSEEIILRPKGNLATASLVIKKEMLYMEEFFHEASVGDYPLQLYCMLKGTVHYFPNVMSVYRFRTETSFSKTILEDKKFALNHCAAVLRFLVKYNRYTNGQYASLLEEKKAEYLRLAVNQGLQQDFNDFKSICDMLKSDKTSDLFNEVIRVGALFHGITGYDEQLESFIKNNSHIVIWGTGYIAGLVSQQIDEKHIDGYIVSDEWKCDNTFRGKTVWEVSGLPYEVRSVGVIVAVDYKFYKEIKMKLKNFKIYYPMLLQEKSLFSI